MKKLASLFLLHSWLVQAQIPAFLTDSIDQFMNREMARWQIPGAAIAIVKDGQILISKGYGMTDLENGHPVNDETLFMIASNSKAFTGTSLALLQDEGKLHLDDHVTDYLPWLDLYDDCATDMVTIKDMVTHRIGLQTFQGDFLHWEATSAGVSCWKKWMYTNRNMISEVVMAIVIWDLLQPERSLAK